MPPPPGLTPVQRGAHRWVHTLAQRLGRRYWYPYDATKEWVPPSWEASLVGCCALGTGAVVAGIMAVAQVVSAFISAPVGQLVPACVSAATCALCVAIAYRQWAQLERQALAFADLGASRRYQFAAGRTPFLDKTGATHFPGVPQSVWQPPDYVGRWEQPLSWPTVPLVGPWAGRFWRVIDGTFGFSILVARVRPRVRPWFQRRDTVVRATTQALPPAAPPPTTSAPPPVTPPAATATIEPRHNRRWRMPWVPFQRTYTIEKDADNISRKVLRKKLLPDRRDATKAFIERSQWLHEARPDRYTVVREWHSATYGAGEVASIRGDSPHYVEWIEGCLVASEPKYADYRLPPGPLWDAFRNLQKALRATPPLSDTAVAPSLPPLPTEPCPLDLFHGIGFCWDQRHTQLWDKHAGYALAGVTTQAPDQGEPRPFGIGRTERGLRFTSKADMRQHGGVFGSTGVGKTRLLEQHIHQLITGGDPIICVDPKGDFDLIDRTFEVGCWAGRACDIFYFDLAKPENPNVASYNPYFNYADPSYLGDRTGAVIKECGDAFWREQAIATARRIYMAVHYTREYLRFLGRSPRTGALPPETCDRVPLPLLALQWAQAAGRIPSSPEQAVAIAAEAQTAVSDILSHLDDPSWVAPNDVVRNVSNMARMPEYTPRHWVPTIRHSSEALDKTAEFLGWMTKIRYFHAYLRDGFAAPDFPRTATASQIIAGAGGEKAGGGHGESKNTPNLWDVGRQSGTHPLLARAPRAVPVPQNMLGIKYLLDALLPPRMGDDAEIRKILSLQGSNLESIASWAQQDRSKFLEMNTTLQAALVRFQGIREQKVCAIDPDIRWDDAIANNRIVYLNLNANIDGDGAAGMAKMAIEDLSSYVGKVYDEHDPRSGQPKQFFLIIDEIRYAVCSGLIKLLAMARGAGCSVFLAGQTLANLRAGLGGDADQAAEVFSNLNTFYQLRAGNFEDAKAFSERCGEVKIFRRNESKNINPGFGNLGNELIHLLQVGSNINSEIKDVPLIPPALVAKLPRGQALCLTAGGSTVELLSFGMFPEPTTNIKMEFANFTAAEADIFEAARAEARKALQELDDERDRDALVRSLLLRDKAVRQVAEMATAASLQEDEVVRNATAERAANLGVSDDQRASLLAESASSAAAQKAQHEARMQRLRADGQAAPRPTTRSRPLTRPLAGAAVAPAATAAAAHGPQPTGHGQAALRDIAADRGMPHPPTGNLDAPPPSTPPPTSTDAPEPTDWDDRPMNRP